MPHNLVRQHYELAQHQRECLQSDKPCSLGREEVALLCKTAPHVGVWLQNLVALALFYNPYAEVVAAQKASAECAAKLGRQRLQKCLAATQLAALGKAALKNERQRCRLASLGWKG